MTRNATTCLLLLILVTPAKAQIAFEKGFMIDNQGNRKECLIRNIDWHNNPHEFQYRLPGAEDMYSAGLQSVKEFGIYNSAKYIRSIVKIDRSSELEGRLTNVRSPFWSEEKVFLRSLVEGAGSLYFYRDNNLIRFFYKTGDGTIEQLVFKKYSYVDKKAIENQTKIAVNADFRQQLFVHVRCGNVLASDLEDIRYTEKDLVKYFTAYNECAGSPDLPSSDVVSSNGKPSRQKPAFHLSVTPGATLNTIAIKHDSYKQYDAEFKNAPGFRLGLEGEFVLPYNKNKWALILDPTYQYYSSTVSNASQNVSLDYSLIALQGGLRHYFFLSQDSRIYLNALFVSNFSVKLGMALHYDDYDEVQPRSAAGFAVGGGIMRRKIGAELRFASQPLSFNEYAFFSSKGSKLSFIFRYRLF